MSRIWLLILTGWLSFAGGCSFREPSMQSSDPALKVPAIKAAAQSNDLSAGKQLVAELDNDDPAIRFYAISALERLTGQRLGYEYYQEREHRQAAIKRWEEWLAARDSGGPTTQPAGKSLVISH
jgi:hypothetical protein